MTPRNTGEPYSFHTRALSTERKSETLVKFHYTAPIILLLLGLFGHQVTSAREDTAIRPAPVSPASSAPPTTAEHLHLTEVEPSTLPTTTTTVFVLTEEQLAYLKEVKTAAEREKWGKCGEWHDLAIAVGWPEAQWKYLQEVIFRESRCQADSWNGADAGLLQINRIHSEFITQLGLGTFPDGMFVAENNLRFALKLWEGSGTNCWKHWRFSGETFGCEK